MSYSAGNVPKAGAAVVSLHNILKEKVARKQPVIGSWLMLPGFNLARLVANQGWDFVLVDCVRLVDGYLLTAGTRRCG